MAFKLKIIKKPGRARRASRSVTFRPLKSGRFAVYVNGEKKEETTKRPKAYRSQYEKMQNPKVERKKENHKPENNHHTHLVLVNREGEYQCPICKTISHIGKVDENKKYHCVNTWCHTRFYLEKTLFASVRMYTTDRLFICPYCDGPHSTTDDKCPIVFKKIIFFKN